MKKILLLLAFSLSFFSCKKDPKTSDFAGIWSGTYTGTDDHGTFSVSIDANGKATGSATSEVFSETFQLIGSVNANGQVVLTFGQLSSGGTFMGTMNKTSASGTWENKMTTPNYSGSWTGNKQ